MSKKQQVRLTVSVPGGRLDKVLAAAAGIDLSRSRWQKLIRDGHVVVDGRVIERPSHSLEGGERITVIVPEAEPVDLHPEAIPLKIVYEDGDLLVIDKPPGMVVHPSPGHASGTLIHAALAHLPGLAEVGGRLRPGVVHRLDKDTSGLILLAKNDRTHQWLQRQFSQRQVEKEYLALVDGHPPTPEGRVDAGIGRDRVHRKKMAIQASGRPAQTEYHTQERFSEHTLLKVRPRTGRTHQIRVHMAFLGCPVVGDRVYGRRTPSLPVARHMLHAAGLLVRVRAGEPPMSFHARLPDDMERVLADLRDGPKRGGKAGGDS